MHLVQMSLPGLFSEVVPLCLARPEKMPLTSFNFKSLAEILQLYHLKKTNKPHALDNRDTDEKFSLLPPVTESLASIWILNGFGELLLNALFGLRVQQKKPKF